MLCPLPKWLPMLHTLCACYPNAILGSGNSVTFAAQDGDLAASEAESPSMLCSRGRRPEV